MCQVANSENYQSFPQGCGKTVENFKRFSTGTHVSYVNNLYDNNLLYVNNYMIIICF
jgi:hypothetical protein